MSSIFLTNFDNTHKFTTEDDTVKPVVTNIKLNDTGAGAPVNGSIVIEFSEKTDNITTSNVSLDNGTLSLSEGSWDTTKRVYTIHYSGLDYITTYTITISGFQDKSAMLWPLTTGITLPPPLSLSLQQSGRLA